MPKQSKQMISALLVTVVLFFSGEMLAQTANQQGKVPAQYVIGGADAQRVHDFVSINGATAEKLSHVCEDLAKKFNSGVVIAIMDPYGNLIHLHAMDGQRYQEIVSAQGKARTALQIKAPTDTLQERTANNVGALVRYRTAYDYDTQSGGFPIIVNGQMIGAIGVSGAYNGANPSVRTGPTKDFNEETCAQTALTTVFGGQAMQFPPAAPAAAPQGGPQESPQRGGGRQRQQQSQPQSEPQ